MYVLLWIAVGAAIGSIARSAMPGPPAGGMRVALVVGIASACVGGLVGSIVETRHSNLGGLSVVTAGIGAMYVLFAYRCWALRI